jgi:uncharacterized metal-binding protein
MENTKPQCATCRIEEKICRSPNGQGPAFCPTLYRKELVRKANKEYTKPDVLHFAHKASDKRTERYVKTEAKPPVNPLKKTRVQETCEFAQRMGYKKLGIAFCSAVHQETSCLSQILEAQGFEVVSVVCKTGRTPKEYIGIDTEQEAQKSMCSPIAQAMILNEEKTDFNILVGLCVGHDSLFLKYSNAYCTVLVAKDQALNHNPVAALCPTSLHYNRLLKKGL